MHELTEAKVASRSRRGLIAIWSVCLIAMSYGSPIARAQGVTNQSMPAQSAPLQSTPQQSSPATSKPQEPHSVPTMGPSVGEIRTDGKIFRLGATCTRRTDTEPGVYRKDGCNRWYCGRMDKEDISAILPRLSVNVTCTWQVEASNQCVCRPLASNGTPTKGAQ